MRQASSAAAQRAAKARMTASEAKEEADSAAKKHNAALSEIAKEWGANTLRAEDVLVTAQQLVSVAKMLDQKWGDMDQATQAARALG